MSGHQVSSTFQINFNVDTSDITDTILKMQERLSPSGLKTFLITKAHRDLRRRTTARFNTEGDDATGPWAQLAFMTGRIRAFQGYGPFHPINVRTGQLRSFVLNSFTVKEQSRGVTLMMPGAASGKLLSKFKQAQQGGGGKTRTSRPTVYRATVQHTEGDAGPNRMAPARPVLALSVTDKWTIVPDLLQWIRVGLV